MKQLFIIYDYDDGQALGYYLTDNAKGCEEIMEDIDTMDYEDIDEQYDATYPARESWEDYFVWKCKQKGISVTKLNDNDVTSYDY